MVLFLWTPEIINFPTLLSRGEQQYSQHGRTFHYYSFYCLIVELQSRIFLERQQSKKFELSPFYYRRMCSIIISKKLSITELQFVQLNYTIPARNIQFHPWLLRRKYSTHTREARVLFLCKKSDFSTGETSSFHCSTASITSGTRAPRSRRQHHRVRCATVEQVGIAHAAYVYICYL